MILVCDTNVLVSALSFPGGIPDRILRAAITGRFRNATSPDMLTELRRVFKEKFGFTSQEAEVKVQRVAEVSLLVYPTERVAVVQKDSSDNRILECVREAHAEYLITGDKKHLLPLKKFQGCRILSPRSFADLHIL